MSDETSKSVISLSDVQVHFSNRQGPFDFFSSPETVQAVDGVSLDIQENEVIALIGESGCGKTTLGKTAIGLQQPTAGSVRYRGQDIWSDSPSQNSDSYSSSHVRKSLQMIHQDPGSSLNPNRKVSKILESPLKQLDPNPPREERNTRIINMLETVGMTPPEDYAGRYPHQLSGGEKQRVALIRALLMNPDLILADEAISALDVSLRIEMMDLFLELQEEFDTSYLFISHDLSNARYLAEESGGRIGVMYLGKIVEIGPASQIVNNPQHPYTKALRWATPDLNVEHRNTESPIRKIDVPDPVDPPSGCRFHTRCPKAREICTSRQPQLFEAGRNRSAAACFRVLDDHEYYDSPSITDE